MNATKTEKIQNLDIPLRTRLLGEGFIDVTGLREYVFGFIPTRKVGASLLANNIKSFAWLGMPPDSRWIGYKGPWPKAEDLYLVIVDENGKILISKKHIKPLPGMTDLQNLDIRLTEFADRTYQPDFTETVVRPHRLRAGDIFARFAAPIPGLDE